MAPPKQPSWYTTALEAVHGTNLTGKTSLVTGGNSGIGVETVKALATSGSRVVLTSRSVEAGVKVAEQLKAEGVKGQIKVMQLDLADLASVNKFSKAYKAEECGPDLLILNAGVMACPQTYTKDGFEMQIGTNHFGHFALTKELLPSMKALGTPARIVVVSSMAHEMGAIDLQDLHYRHRAYSSWGAYGQSKLANILFAKQLAKDLEGTNIKAYSLHPGIINTPLTKHVYGGGYLGAAVKTAVGIIGYPWLKSPAQGAATSITAAVSPDLESHSGVYLHDSQIKKPARAAEDMDMAAELWKETERQLADAEKKLSS
ncbi:g12713 [Coccomyxa viridis]|uniref:G12713 protein n=1 Tax=Coccomyxa viridis TaxID=1274662 RepID=A0ABP1GDM9_9CHLO